MREDLAAILDMEHHVSKRRAQMSNRERAAQFMPFAALNGYEAAIRDAAVIPEPDWNPDEDQKAALNEALMKLEMLPRDRRHASICRVQHDDLRGAVYTQISGHVRCVDTASRTLAMEHGLILGLDEIASIRIPGETDDFADD